MSRRRLVRERPADYGSVVVDASVAVQWFAREPGSETSATLLEGSRPLLAPDLLPVEVAGALWKKSRTGELAGAEVPAAITRLLDAHIVFASTLELLLRATRLAVQTGHPIYDCVYLALAVEHGAVLATADTRLGRTAVVQGLRLWKS